MTSSREKPPAPRDDLPPAISSMWRLCKLGYRHEPGLIVASFALVLLAALPDALLAFWFKLLGEGTLQGDWRQVRLAVLALGISATATWFLQTVSVRVQRRFRDKVTIALESHVATLLASIATIAHQERREYLDRLAVLRNQVFMLDHMYMSLFGTFGWILRLGVTIALLMSIHPALALLAVFAVPPVFTSTWRPAVERQAYERGASRTRLARHLFDVATATAPGKEVRVTGIGARLAADRRSAWESGNRPVAAARMESAAWHTLAWTIFGLGYVGAIVFVAWGLRAMAGDVLLTLAAGSRLSFYVGGAVGEIGFLRGVWMDSSRRLAWLEDYARAVAATADWPAPASRVRQPAASMRARSVRSIRIRPPVGSYIFASSLTSVVLPAPFSPTTATTDPAGSSTFTSSITSRSVQGYANETCSKRIASVMMSGAGRSAFAATAAS